MHPLPTENCKQRQALPRCFMRMQRQAALPMCNVAGVHVPKSRGIAQHSVNCMHGYARKSEQTEGISVGDFLPLRKVSRQDDPLGHIHSAT